MRDVNYFLREFVSVQDNGCWLWTGLLSPAGYGRLYADGKSWRAHKYVFLKSGNTIPTGHVLDHRCHDPNVCRSGRLCPHRACVNPAHLEAVTHKENIRRGATGKQEREKTQCPQGHEYDESNTYIRPSGGRVCRKCGRNRVRVKRNVPPENFRQHDADWGYGPTLADV